MKGRDGGLCHRKIRRDLEQVLADLHLVARREVTVVLGEDKDIGHIDLVVENKGQRLAIEIEMSPRRILKDRRKAAALGAWLWIVVPNTQVRRAVRNRLTELGVRENYPRLVF